ncbi:E3 ubiquitin-protein ligase ZNRF2-like [Ornithodoros turicata]|uniref:E3 ubiquitin-protein ligase ZNRF1 n=1 Tax=Ornithodoros turicata TaxID=34597 RepID=A0A2R5L5N0_9ACAR
MGGKQSTTTSNSRGLPSGSADSGTATSTGAAGETGGGLSLLAGPHRSVSGSSADARIRARSLSSVLNGHSGQPLTIPPTQSGFGTPDSPPESGASTPDSMPFGRVFAAHSLPVQFVSFNGIKCPVCSKFVLPDDVECHLVMCLTKPRISYNDDVLTEDKGECVICLEDLTQGDTIARLPCLCIYHKRCIDAWFEVNRSCPEHPLD